MSARRTTSLTLAGLLGLGLLAPTTTASIATAGTATCQGLPATIVGEPGSRVVGTEGADVIVTDGAMSVDSLGGDDVICVSAQSGFPAAAPVDVRAGAGNDVVDGTDSGNSLSATLGTGADTFVGSRDDDRVTLAYPDVTTATPDTVDGARGSDALLLSTGPGAAVIDNVAGRLTSGGEVRTTWSGLEEFWTAYSREARPLTFLGSDADEVLVDGTAVPTQVEITLGRGEDTYRTGVAPAQGSRVRGGPGRDRVGVTSVDASLEVDLKRYRTVVDASTPYRVLTVDFEDAEVVAPEVLLRGGTDRNVLEFTACRAVVRGRDGADTIRRGYDAYFEPRLGCPESARIAGGPGPDVVTGTRGGDTISGNDGDDVLRGGSGPDRLFGGGGGDTADGGKGRDRCNTERERRCER